MDSSNNNQSLDKLLDSLDSCEVSSLYVHIPFCFHKCHYCDFYSIVDNKNRQKDFTNSLISELKLATSKLNLKPKTIFFGGGTPTLLDSNLWEKLLGTLQDLSLLDSIEEFTVEANPETVDENLVRVLSEGGVNRMSLGAQSFDTRLLKTLERWHDPESVKKAVHIAQIGGIDNINLDLIFAIPGQTQEQLDSDLNKLLELNPSHLSCYSLIFEPGTAITKKKQLGKIEPMDKSIEALMYKKVIARLREAGFCHYEVSNWALSDKKCQHNLTYWQGRDYLGVGPSASSYIKGQRWRNKPNLGAYIATAPNTPIMDYEKLDKNQSAGEMLMLGLRLSQGISESWLNSALDTNDNRRKIIKEFEAKDLLKRQDGFLRVTQRGAMVVDGIAEQLL